MAPLWWLTQSMHTMIPGTNKQLTFVRESNILNKLNQSLNFIVFKINAMKEV